jgi:hypothetical protein
LPWGTKAEKKIPRHILLEAELAVARAQLATQTPGLDQLPAAASEQQGKAPGGTPATDSPTHEARGEAELAVAAGEDSFAVSQAAEMAAGRDDLFAAEMSMEPVQVVDGVPCDERGVPLAELPPPTAPLPTDWPDPARLIPEPPHPEGAPAPLPQSEPIMSHTRIYRGDDSDFTEKLADYVYAMDDGRLGGWQGYLTRSNDFIRFCCHLHITEMLEMRGGRDQSDLIIRWPIGRYRR